MFDYSFRKDFPDCMLPAKSLRLVDHSIPYKWSRIALNLK